MSIPSASTMLNFAASSPSRDQCQDVSVVIINCAVFANQSGDICNLGVVPSGGAGVKHWGFVHVVDGYGDLDSTGATPRVRGRDVEGLCRSIFVVQHRRCAQLAGSTDAEVGIIHGVSQGVVVCIGGPDRVPQPRADTRIFGHLAGIVFGGECRRLVKRIPRRADSSRGDRANHLDIAVFRRVGGLHSQRLANIYEHRGVSVGIAAYYGRCSASRPLPGDGIWRPVAIGQGSHHGNIKMGVLRGQGDGAGLLHVGDGDSDGLHGGLDGVFGIGTDARAGGVVGGDYYDHVLLVGTPRIIFVIGGSIQDEGASVADGELVSVGGG